MNGHEPDPKQRLIDAALLHVPFDGWTKAAYDAAVAESGVAPVLADALCPRGAVDLAVAYHKAGDVQMLERLAASDLSDMRFRDKVTAAVRYRIEAAADREVVRRGTTLFASPRYASDGARLIWETSDAIWRALGDSSRDVNWYTKRATLSAVYSATVLYWLGDDSPDHEKTWAFLDRRIDNVMQFEKTKAQMRDNPVLKRAMAGPNRLMSAIKAPAQGQGDLPGTLNPKTQE